MDVDNTVTTHSSTSARPIYNRAADTKTAAPPTLTAGLRLLACNHYKVIQ